MLQHSYLALADWLACWHQASELCVPRFSAGTHEHAQTRTNTHKHAQTRPGTRTHDEHQHITTQTQTQRATGGEVQAVRLYSGPSSSRPRHEEWQRAVQGRKAGQPSWECHEPSTIGPHKRDRYRCNEWPGAVAGAVGGQECSATKTMPSDVQTMQGDPAIRCTHANTHTHLKVVGSQGGLG